MMGRDSETGHELCLTLLLCQQRQAQAFCCAPTAGCIYQGFAKSCGSLGEVMLLEQEVA